MIAKYVNGKWKAIKLTTFIIFDEINSGDCFCEIFSKGKGKFIVELMKPNGEEYEKKTIPIKIQNPTDNPLQLIPFIKEIQELILDKKEYYRIIKIDQSPSLIWDVKTGYVYDKKEKKVAKEKSTSKLIRELIRLRYPDKCSAVLLRKKRRYK